MKSMNLVCDWCGCTICVDTYRIDDDHRPWALLGGVDLCPECDDRQKRAIEAERKSVFSDVDYRASQRTKYG